MNLLIIGGDERSIALKDILKKNNFNVHSSFLNENEKDVENLNDFDIIILPIPFERESKLNAPFYDKEIKSSYTLEKLKHFKGTIIGGFNKKNEEFFVNENLNFKNILEDENFTLINAIITAEGSIEKLIHESYKSLFESNVCILGYGRIGKALSRRMYSLCNKLTVYNNPSINLTYTKIDNINSHELKYFKDHAPQYNIIINTIPHLIINKEILDIINKDTLILDLSSNPGGVDFSYAQKLEIKVIHYLGVPAKVSKYSSANAIFSFLLKTLK
ncbi:dipicolinate synthase subunit DpsA [Candidatus Arthromitus sp. SFB-rat-Yit]|uniref:dipicolinate synthase subunit DpsA n=1 Tax=Candidatus Arthromitus sp. SFB-rat-Yit TaxID=1041504 RepID=UPI000227A777|nr:dipicolinate synthase subunit DpsA [Candidatus Arthromitus sp. SFB-rat-Yit]BAK81731.1 alanine dehydrogenase/PNT domain protein [Candidatus Arthromitus sp. SFB-rat-Yit]